MKNILKKVLGGSTSKLGFGHNKINRKSPGPQPENDQIMTIM